MDFTKYFTVLVVLCLEGGETGGHGEKHHDHVKLHIPEFIHHDHHTKVITIHHHHHKPKKEHHHHHHHHHKKPQVPHGHHYHNHHKKVHTTTHTVSKGHHTHHGNKGHGHHGNHGHHGHSSHPVHHGHHSHHNHHGHGHYGNGHHHDTPSYSYDPPSVPSFEDDFGQTYTSSVPSYSGGVGYQKPQIHGITHTVKQVKVYDSLPGALPSNTGSHGYEVTEEGEHSDDDVFTSVNSLQQTYPMTYGYVRSLADQSPSHNPFTELTPQHTIQNHDAFGAVAQPTAYFADANSFTGKAQNDPFSSANPVEYTEALNLNVQPPTEFTGNFLNSDSEQAKVFPGVQEDVSSFTANDEIFSNEVPVSFAREAGIQQTAKTGGVETIEY